MEKAGKPTGYVRFVSFENGVIVDASISPANLVDTIAKGMGQDKKLAEAIQAAVAMYKVRQHPIGRMIADFMFSTDGPCGCGEDCDEKNESNGKETADAEKTAG